MVVPKFKTHAPKMSAAGKLDAIFRIFETAGAEGRTNDTERVDEDSSGTESESETSIKDGIRIKQ